MGAPWEELLSFSSPASSLPVALSARALKTPIFKDRVYFNSSL